MRVLQTGVADKQREDQPAIGALAYAPDGTRLATVGTVIEQKSSGSRKWRPVNQLLIWDVVPGVELVSERLSTGAGRCVQFLPGGRELAVGSGRKQLQIREAESGELRHMIGMGLDVSCLASPDEGTLIAGSTRLNMGTSMSDHPLCQYRLDTWERTRSWSMRPRTAIATPDGTALIAGFGENGGLLTIPLAASTKPKAWDRSMKSIRTLAITPNGQTLALNEGWGVGLWDVAKRKQIAVLKGHRQQVNAVAFSPDGRLLASGAADGAVRFWDVETRTERAAFEWGFTGVNCVAFSPDGLTCAVGGRGAVTLVIWDVEE